MRSASSVADVESGSITPWMDLLEQFEQAWQGEAPPRIDEFLQKTAGGQTLDEAALRLLLEELVAIDLEYRWRRSGGAKAGGESTEHSLDGWPVHPCLEDYAQRYIELGGMEQLPVDLIVEEYRVRARCGKCPEHTEYSSRFPHHQELMKRLAQVDIELAAEQPAQGRGQPTHGPRPVARETVNCLGEELVQTPVPYHAGDRVEVSAISPEPTYPCIPGYEILGELGRGGMGVVYKARQVQLKRTVAVKMILAGAQADLEHLARFRTEAEAVARLQHANIVQVYEVGEYRGCPYFSMDLLDSGSLDRRLNGTPLPPREAAQLLESLAQAMNYAHEHKVVHRDLKPANVLLPAGEMAPKITDFGLAKQLDLEAGHRATWHPSRRRARRRRSGRSRTSMRWVRCSTSYLRAASVQGSVGDGHDPSSRVAGAGPSEPPAAESAARPGSDLLEVLAKRAAQALRQCGGIG